MNKKTDIVSGLNITLPLQLLRIYIHMPFLNMDGALGDITRPAHTELTDWVEYLSCVLGIQVLCYYTSLGMMRLCSGSTCDEDVSLDRCWKASKESVVYVFT